MIPREQRRAVEIRVGVPGDVPRMKRLWQLCFGDGDELISLFYDDRRRSDQALVLTEGGVLRAMTTLLPMETVDENGARAATPCVYAVATDPQCRGLGYASRLLEAAWERLEGDGLLVVPAGEALFRFYRERGFADSFAMREAVLTPEAIAALPATQMEEVRLHPMAPGAYGALREQFLAGQAHVRFDEATLAYQEQLGMLGGGGLFTLEAGETRGCAAVERASDEIIVKELLLPDPWLTAGVKALAAFFTCERMVVRTPAFLGAALGGEVRPFAQARLWGRHLDAAYLGLAFD